MWKVFYSIDVVERYVPNILVYYRHCDVLVTKHNTIVYVIKFSLLMVSIFTAESITMAFFTNSFFFSTNQPSY